MKIGEMEYIKPILLFITSSTCDHCRDFRGIDGRPSDDKEWSSSLIRKYLTGTTESSYNKKLLCSKIIEIHDSGPGDNISKISEFNIYVMIPSDIRIDGDFINEILSDDNDIIGDSILRICIRRREDDMIIIEIEIDGDDTDRRCEYIKKLVEDFFIWSRVPIEIDNLRSFFRGDKRFNYEDLCKKDLNNESFYKLVSKKKNIYSSDPEEFDKDLRYRYKFSWFISKNFPVKIRQLQIFYPTWMLISPLEWKKGLETNEPIYARVKNCTTTLKERVFSSKQNKSETIDDMIKQYYGGRLKLSYSESLLDNFNNQNIKQLSTVKNNNQNNSDIKNQNTHAGKKKVTFAKSN